MTTRRIRAVVYGAGAMGTVATRMMLEKGVDVVGAIARSPQKVGRDLGELAGIDRLNVVVESDAEQVLSNLRPDIVLLATQSFIPEISSQLELCVSHGSNVLTISEESLYPWSSSPQETARLDALAKGHDVTITGSGHQDLFWMNLVCQLMGASHRIDSVHGRCSWNADEYGADAIKSKHVGESLEQFEISMNSETRPPTYGRNVLGAMLASLGLTAKRWSSDVTPVITETSRASKSIGVTLDPGTVVGYADVDTVETFEGPSFTFEMGGYVYEPGDTDINEWRIEGEPTLEMSNGAVPTNVTTCTQWVNRIPDVINAPAGFVTVDQLPPLRYRARPLHTYVQPGRLL